MFVVFFSIFTTNIPAITAQKFSPNTSYNICFTPGENCTAKIVGAINSAQQSILVQAYTITSRPIEKALVKAARKNIDVKIIMDKNQYNQFPDPINYLASQNIPIWFDYNLTGLAHNKVIIIDGTIVITGSFNFTKAAQNNNAENLLIIYDKKLALTYNENWQKRLAQSCKMTNAECKKNIVPK